MKMLIKVIKRAKSSLAVRSVANACKPRPRALSRLMLHDLQRLA